MKKILQFCINEFRQHKLDYLLILLIVLTSAFFRFKPLFTGDFVFLFDQGRDMLDVKEIVVGHHPTLIGPFTGMKGLFQSPMHYYLLAIPFILTGGHPAGGIAFTIITFLVGITLAYVLGKRMYGRLFGLFFALIFAFAQGSMSNSANFWNPNWIPPLMVPYLYSLYRSRKDLRWLLAVSFLVGLMSQFEAAFGVMLLISTLLFLLVSYPKVFISKWFYLSGIAFAINFIPQVLFDIRHEYMMTNTLVNLITGRTESLGIPIPFDVRFWYRIDEVTKATIFTILYDRTLALTTLIPILGTLIIAVRKKDWSTIKAQLFFAGIPFCLFLVFLAFPLPAWAWYWTGLQVCYYALVAYSCAYLWHFHKFAKVLDALLLALWVGLATFPAFIPSNMPEEPGTFKTQVKIMDDIYADAAGEPFGVFVYTPPIYDFAFKYLFWWRGITKYNYVPTDSKDGTFYLIIEPNKDNPLAIDGWKKTVIKEGQTVWTKKYPGDIEVEKRQGK